MLKIAFFTVLFLTRPSAALSQKTAADFVAVGDSAVLQQNGVEALTAYMTALKIDSINIDLMRKLISLTFSVVEGRSSFISSHQLYDTAQMIADRLYAIDSITAGTHFAMAQIEILHTRIAHSHNPLMDGIGVYDKIGKCLSIDDNHSGCSTLMGGWYMEVLKQGAGNRLEHAINLLKKENRLREAAIYAAVSWDSSIKYLEHSVSTDPNRRVHLYNLAMARFMSGDTSNAIKTFEKVIAAPDKDFNDEHYKRRSQSYLSILTRRN